MFVTFSGAGRDVSSCSRGGQQTAIQLSEGCDLAHFGSTGVGWMGEDWLPKGSGSQPLRHIKTI